MYFTNLKSAVYAAPAQAGSFRQTKTQIFCTCVGRIISAECCTWIAGRLARAELRIRS